MFNLIIRKMKRILTVTLVFALVAFVFSSCSKDKKDKELKTLEGTSWAADAMTPYGKPIKSTLDFAPSTDSFTLHLYYHDGDEDIFRGSYTFNKPNIRFDVYEVQAPKAPAPALEEPEFTFYGVLIGKTLSFDLEGVNFVFNMK